MGLVLKQRDYRIMKDLERFRFCLSRHIKLLAEFSGQRACDRRIKLLIEAGYIDRKKVLYGIPSLYYLTHKGKMLIGANKRQDKIRVDKIAHDVTVIDTVVYFIYHHKISIEKIQTEKELNSIIGFTTKRHQPDFIYEKEGKKYCVEIELTAKSKKRFEEIVEENYLNYETQHWVIAKHGVKIRAMIERLIPQYTNIEIIELEEVQEYVRVNNENIKTE